MAEPMQTDDPVATAAAAQPKQKQKVDRLTEGRDAPWVEKYRPKTLDDVAAHKEIIDTSGCTNASAMHAKLGIIFVRCASCLSSKQSSTASTGCCAFLCMPHHASIHAKH
jgi:hypothetical protein